MTSFSTYARATRTEPQRQSAEALTAIEAPPIGLTEDELKDWHVLDVKAKLAGWHMKAAHKAGKTVTARLHMEAMYAATRGRIALRRLGNERVGACHFDSTGEIDAGRLA